MQFEVNAAGRRVYPSEFKRQVLVELRTGATPSEVSRRHGVPIQNIVKWRRCEEMAVMGQAVGNAETSEMVPVAEYKRALEEIKNLRRSLADMTVDRDILKEAHSIAVKKKWILPAK